MIKLLVALVLSLIPSVTIASLTEAEKQEISPRNLLGNKNGGFEAGPTIWTKTGGTFTTTSALSATGNFAGRFTASAAGQTITSAAVTGIQATYGQAGCLSSTTISSFTIAVKAGTSTLASAAIPASATTFGENLVAFTFPASGSVALEVRSNASGTIDLDDCYIGRPLSQMITPFSGTVMVVGARITNAGTPAVGFQYGNWITSVTDSGVGFATLNVASGIFSTNVMCVCSTNVGSGAGHSCQVAGSSGTVVEIQTRDDTGTAEDQAFYVYCMGQK